jgi:hypothetical protein
LNREEEEVDELDADPNIFDDDEWIKCVS